MRSRPIPPKALTKLVPLYSILYPVQRPAVRVMPRFGFSGTSIPLERPMWMMYVLQLAVAVVVAVQLFVQIQTTRSLQPLVVAAATGHGMPVSPP